MLGTMELKQTATNTSIKSFSTAILQDAGKVVG